MKRFLGILLTVFCVTSCNWFQPDTKERQAVLIYFAGNNNLSGYGTEDLGNLTSSYMPSYRDKEHFVLVYHHFTDQTPSLSRFYTDRHGEIVEEVIKTYPFSTNSASAATLETVIADAENAYPAERHGLILWSHATGFLPAGYFSNPRESAGGAQMLQADPETDPYAWLVKSDGASLQSFAEDHGDEIELPDLRKAVSRFHYDYLIFDACLMSNVEVAYELRNCCDYLLMSPTEILADGLPYDSIIETLTTLPTEQALRKIGEDYMAYYRTFTGVYRSATITLVRTSGLEKLAAACKPVFQNHASEIMTLDRSKVQPYFRYNKHWFYDLDDFVGQVASDSEYAAFVSALAQTVVYKDATENFIDIEIKKYSGLSIYIPRPEYTVLNNYYKTLAWNQASGLVP